MIITDNDYIEQISSIIPMHIILQYDLNPSVRCITVHLIISFRNVFEFTSQFYFARWDHFTTMIIKWHWIKLKSCVIVCQCTKYFIDVFRNLLIFTSWNSQFSPVIVVNSTIYFFVTFFKSWRVAKPAENKPYGLKRSLPLALPRSVGIQIVHIEIIVDNIVARLDQIAEDGWFRGNCVRYICF